MAFSDQEMEEFKTEAFELLDVAERSLLSLDQGSGDYRTCFDAVFRSLHNLKGAAGMMELHRVQSHTHELESLLMNFKEQTSIPKEYISLFLRGVDGARALLCGQEISFSYSVNPSATVQSVEVPAPNEVVQTSFEIEPAPVEAVPAFAVNEFVQEAEEIVDRVGAILQKIEEKLFEKSDLESLYRDVHSLKGAAYLFSFQCIGDIAHGMESSLENVRNGTHQPTGLLVDLLFQCLQSIEEKVELIRTQGRSVGNSEAWAILNDLLMNAAKELPLIGALPSPQITLEPEPVAEPAVEATLSKNDDRPVVKTEVAVETVTSSPATGPSVAKDKDPEANSSIRVSVALLDNLMTLMGEMVLVRNQVIQFSSKTEDLEFLTLSKRLNVVTSEIQGEMMKTRMQPIGNVLSKFTRVVRDLSHDLKKEINLELVGSDTELDKSLLEAIKDPLTHIVRNSCDHGVETPAVRMSHGKPRQGTIQVRAFHEGGQVVIEVTDDGKGLNKEILIKKALEKGLIHQNQVAELSEKEIFNLIFAAGFSTAAEVTNVSGRGVGMDVVRTNVEKIGGSVELQSVLGRGTTTRLKIPLTLAIIPALIVRSNGDTFAIPQVKLEELVRVDQMSAEHKIEHLHGSPVFRLRGNLLPLVDLNRILGRAEKQIEAQTTSNIAVLNADGISFGLIIDEIQDTADIVVKPINRLLKSLHVYSGATILGDGSIALILDVTGLAKIAQIGTDRAKAEDVVGGKNEDRRLRDQQEFLVIRLNSPTKHALVLGYVHRLEEFRRSNLEFSGHERVIRYGNAILPILSVSELLGYGASAGAASKEIIQVVVVQKAGRLYGFEVDEIADIISTDKDVDSAGKHKTGVYGALNLPEELIVVVDPFDLVGVAFPELAVKDVGIESTKREPAVHLRKEPQRKNSIKRLLLVEDTAFFRKAISSVLMAAGYDVTIATDGRDALDLLAKGTVRFDIIISDIEMPRVNGFELVKAVRANPHWKSVPMLAISSRADQSYTEKGLQMGFDVYLEKLKPAILLEAVQQLTQVQGKVA